MKLFFYISFCIVSFCLSAQNHFLPFAENGKWGLVDSKGTYILKPKYDYIEFSKVANKYLYHLAGMQGLIDQQGRKYLTKDYEEIKCLDDEYTVVRTAKKWQLVKGNQIAISEDYDSISQLNKSFFLLFDGNRTLLRNLESNLYFEGKFTSASPFFYNLIKLENKQGEFTIIEEAKLTIIVDDIVSFKDFGTKFSIAVSKDSSYLFDFNSKSIIWRVKGEVEMAKQNYFYSASKKSSLLFNPKTKRQYVVPKIDEILSISGSFLRYQRNGFVGVWNFETNSEVIPSEYERIMKVGNYWYVNHYNKNGVFANSGKAIIPVDFDDIEEYDQCFKVKKSNFFGLYGLYGDILEPITYKEIRVYDNSAKCLDREKLVLLSFDSSGKLTDKKTFNDFMSIDIKKQSKPRQRSSAVRFSQGNQFSPTDRAAKKFGWYRPILKKVLNSDTIEYRGRWGLKDVSDSVVIRPKYGSIRIIDTLGFTKAYRTDIDKLRRRGKDLTYDLVGITNKPKELEAVFDPAFVLIDHNTGKKIGKNSYIGLLHQDFLEGNLARGYINKPVLINRVGEIIWNNLTFFSNYHEGFISICQGGNVSFRRYNFKYEGEVVGPFIQNLGAVYPKLKNNQLFMKVNNGRWYYLNRKGKPLNEIPYQYGGRFKDGKAIVKFKNKWGVIDTSMKYVIPAEYDMIERIETNDSSFFKVGIKTNENYLYNRASGKLAKTNISQFDQYSNGVWRYRENGNNFWGLIDTNQKIIADAIYTKINPFKSGLAQVLYKSKRSIINTEGTLILPFYKAKHIEKKLDLFAIKTKRGVLLINQQLDTIIDEWNCKSVEDVTEHYVFYLDRNKTKKIFNRITNEILSEKLSILSVSLSNHLALVKKGSKKRLLNLKSNKFLKTMANDILELGDNIMIYRNNMNKFGLMTFERDSITKPIYKEVKTYKNGWSLVKLDKTFRLMNLAGDSIPQLHILRAIPLGDVFKIYGYEGKGIVDDKGQVIIEPKFASIVVHNSNFYKVTDYDNKKWLYDLEGNRITEKPYDNFKAISTAGIVARHDRYDYLYTDYLNKSLSFQNMDPFSSHLFMLNEGFKVGLKNLQGETLLPINYHKIESVGQFWQIRFFNSFGFAKLNGKIIHNPL